MSYFKSARRLFQPRSGAVVGEADLQQEGLIAALMGCLLFSAPARPCYGPVTCALGRPETFGVSQWQW